MIYTAQARADIRTETAESRKHSQTSLSNKVRIINFQQFPKIISQSVDFWNILRPYANSSHFFILRLKFVLSGAKIKCRPCHPGSSAVSLL